MCYTNCKYYLNKKRLLVESLPHFVLKLLKLPRVHAFSYKSSSCNSAPRRLVGRLLKEARGRVSGCAGSNHIEKDFLYVDLFWFFEKCLQESNKQLVVALLFLFKRGLK